MSQVKVLSTCCCPQSWTNIFPWWMGWTSSSNVLLYAQHIQDQVLSQIAMKGSICSACTYEGCSFSYVCRSVKQEVVVWFIHNIHIPSKHSPPLHKHRSSHLHQDSKAVWQFDGKSAWSSEFTAITKFWIMSVEKFPPSQLFFDEV